MRNKALFNSSDSKSGMVALMKDIKSVDLIHCMVSCMTHCVNSIAQSFVQSFAKPYGQVAQNLKRMCIQCMLMLEGSGGIP